MQSAQIWNKNTSFYYKYNTILAGLVFLYAYWSKIKKKISELKWIDELVCAFWLVTCDGHRIIRVCMIRTPNHTNIIYERASVSDRRDECSSTIWIINNWFYDGIHIYIHDLECVYECIFMFISFCVCVFFFSVHSFTSI